MYMYGLLHMYIYQQEIQISLLSCVYVRPSDRVRKKVKNYADESDDFAEKNAKLSGNF